MNLCPLFLHMEEIPHFDPWDEGVPVIMEVDTRATYAVSLMLEETQYHAHNHSQAVLKKPIVCLTMYV